MNRRLALLAPVLVMVALAACAKSTRITTRGAGHEILISVEGSHSIDTDTNRAVISSAYGNVTIERTRVQLGANPWTTIPENVVVEVKISKHKTSVSAKPVTVALTINE